ARNIGLPPAHVAGLLFALAETYRDAGLIDEAMAAYQRCVEIYESINHPISLAMTYNNLAIVHRIRGEKARALKLFKLSLSIKERSGRKGISNTLSHLSDLAENESDAID